jgi:hypothetical protein
MVTTEPDTGNVSESEADSSVSVARISSSGERAVKLLGNAIDQWLGPRRVTCPLVMTEWAIAVFWISISS